MEHVVSRWNNNAQFVVELARRDGHESRATQRYLAEVPGEDGIAQTVGFRLVETETGREVSFPLQLVADSRFGSDR